MAKAKKSIPFPSTKSEVSPNSRKKGKVSSSSSSSHMSDDAEPFVDTSLPQKGA